MGPPERITNCFGCGSNGGIFTNKMTQMAIDVLAFTGHKSLYGLAGIGGLAFSERGAEAVKPLITGGTGSHSNSFDQPSFYQINLKLVR